MSNASYRKWPLADRKPRKIPRRFDLDDFLQLAPPELAEMITWRLQERCALESSVRHRVPSCSRAAEDFTLLGVTLIRIVDALERPPQVRTRRPKEISR